MRYMKLTEISEKPDLTQLQARVFTSPTQS